MPIFSKQITTVGADHDHSAAGQGGQTLRNIIVRAVAAGDTAITLQDNTAATRGTVSASTTPSLGMYLVSGGATWMVNVDRVNRLAERWWVLLMALS